MKTIVFLLDETGSMMPHRDETIAAFNKYLEDTAQAEDPAEPIVFYLTLFHSLKLEQRYAGVPIRDVAPLTDKSYIPDMMTPLYDAIGKTISPIEGEALMVILTDGMENASKEYSLPAVKALIEAKEQAGWKFLFLASGLDVAAQAPSMGVPMHASTPTSGVGHAMRTASLASADYVGGKVYTSAAHYANAAQAVPADDDKPEKKWDGSA